MARVVPRVDRSKPGPDWTVRQVAHRTDWEAAEDACACCGTGVDLRGPHVGMDLVYERPTSSTSGRKTRFERARYVFCDGDCVEDWRVHESA